MEETILLVPQDPFYDGKVQVQQAQLKASLTSTEEIIIDFLPEIQI